MKDNHKGGYTHLTSSERIIIEKGLESNESFSSIAKKVGKHPSTISKEVRKHIIYHVKKDMNKAIPCANRKYCCMRLLCEDKTCTKMCKGCYRLDIKCTDICNNYTPRVCFKLLKAPYVCNGCIKKGGCLMKKSFYSAKHADECYRDLLVSSREGINQSPVDMAMLDELISPLLKKGQSIAHIYAHHGHEIPCCRRTLYNYIDKSLFSARNIDMRRRVRYKVRKQPTRISLEAKTFRVGRTYDDFQKLLKVAPDTSIVEMDTVVGGKGTGSSVLLTMLFRNCSLMLIILINSKSPEAVIKAFD